MASFDGEILPMAESGFFLPPDLQQFVQNQIDRGDYSTTGEVVCAALTLLREREQVRAIRLERLRADLQVGIDELERGEGSALDMEEIKQEVRGRLSPGR